MSLIYGSVCSGVEAATVAWHPLGWKPAWLCEFDKFPSAVLAHHYPDVPNLGDMTKIEERPEYNERSINLLVGGTPCQSFSIAGLRKGLDDDRGNLALKFCRILAEKQPRWFVWENVPGVLSSNKGRDFASILSAFSECGYGFAYRILDAQYFRVAQRRRRVFVIGYLGDWRPAAAVLFERESLSGNSPPRRKAGEKIAPCVTQGPPFSRTGNQRVEAEALVIGKNHWAGGPHPSLSQSHNVGGIGQSNQELFSQGGAGLVEHRNNFKDHMDRFPFETEAEYRKRISSPALNRQWPAEIAPTLNASFGDKQGLENQHINEGGGYSCLAKTLTTKTRIDAETETLIPYQGGFFETVPTLTSNGDAHSGFRDDAGLVVANTLRGEGFDASDNGTGNANLICALQEPARTGVRRLTPRECERLQGFPDDYTLVPWRGKMAPDGPRYKAMGNSMAVPVMRWIGERIQLFENLNIKETV